MAEDKKQELAQLLHEALVNLEIRKRSANKPQLPPIINVHEYRRLLQQSWASHSLQTLLVVLDYEIHIANETTKSKLLDFIRREFASFIHEDQIQSGTFFIGSGSIYGYSLDYLLKQLLKIAIIFGVEKAISDFDKCTENTSGSFQYRAILGGIKVEQEIKVFEGMQLIPLPVSTSELPRYLPLDYQIPGRLIDFLGKTLFVINASISPIFSKPFPDAFQEGFQVEITGGKFPNFKVDDFYEKFCQALSLACNSAVRIALQWRFLAKHELFNLDPLAVSGVGWRTDVNLSRISTVAGKTQIDGAKRLYRALVKLDSNLRERLQIPIDRWIKSKAERNPVDKIIDLGIAFEALYLPKNNIEQLSFQFRLHAAWHLGRNKADREMLMDEFKAIYTLRSKAVHNGEVSEKIQIRKEEERIDTSEFIPRAQDLCRQSIMKILEDGKFPDWNDLILGDESL